MGYVAQRTVATLDASLIIRLSIVIGVAPCARLPFYLGLPVFARPLGRTGLCHGAVSPVAVDHLCLRKGNRPKSNGRAVGRLVLRLRRNDVRHSGLQWNAHQ